MLININNKPIRVKPETEEQKEFSPVYLAVSTSGFLSILWIMDYMYFTFFFKHPFPWIVWVGKILSIIGGMF